MSKKVNTKAELPSKDFMESNLPAKSPNNPPNEPQVKDVAETKPFSLSKAITMRLKNHLSYGEIAKHFSIAKSTVYERLKPIENLIQDPELATAYDDNRTLLLNAAEATLINDLMDEEKRKSASLNNAAFAARTVHDMRRTAKGESLGVMEYHVLTANIKDLQREEEDLRRELEGN